MMKICDTCIHAEVCKQKDRYLRDVETINELYNKISSCDLGADVPDFVVALIFKNDDFTCEHFRRKTITTAEYQKAAYRTVNTVLDYQELLMEGLMALNAEAGECIDILKKALFQGHELDSDKLASELGDVAWYLAISAGAIEYSLEEILNINIEKLKARYPEGFDSNRSRNREDYDI